MTDTAAANAITPTRSRAVSPVRPSSTPSGNAATKAAVWEMPRRRGFGTSESVAGSSARSWPLLLSYVREGCDRRSRTCGGARRRLVHLAAERCDDGCRDRPHATCLQRRRRRGHGDRALFGNRADEQPRHPRRGLDPRHGPSSGRTYTATVTGYSVSKDVAVLELRDAKGLATARTGNSNTVEVGDRVTAVGNGGGSRPDAKSGRVTGLGQSITVSSAGEPFTLVGLIETTTPLRSGTRAARSSPRARDRHRRRGLGRLLLRGQRTGLRDPDQQGAEDHRADRGGAPLVDRPRRADRLSRHRTQPRRDGDEDVAGALVEDVRTPADRAGSAGRPHHVVRRKRVFSAASLRKLVLQASPGKTVRVTWIDPPRKKSAAVRLVAGPPQ